jgi:hypothetical protein
MIFYNLEIEDIAWYGTPATLAEKIQEEAL